MSDYYPEDNGGRPSIVLCKDCRYNVSGSCDKIDFKPSYTMLETIDDLAYIDADSEYHEASLSVKPEFGCVLGKVNEETKDETN